MMVEGNCSLNVPSPVVEIVVKEFVSSSKIVGLVRHISLSLCQNSDQAALTYPELVQTTLEPQF